MVVVVQEDSESNKDKQKNFGKKQTILIFSGIVFLFVILFFVSEYYCYKLVYADESTVLPSVKEHAQFGLPKPTLSTYFETLFADNNAIWSIRETYVENKYSTKKPLLLLGDEIANGLELAREEELSYQLAKKTGRPVYNRAINLPAMQTALFQLRDENFYYEVPKPEYIIFTFSRGCNIGVYRPYVYQLARFNPSFYYKVKNGVLTEDNIRPYLLRFTTYFWFGTSQVVYSEPTREMLDMLGLYFLEIRKEAENHWGNDIKFVVFTYDTVEAVSKLQPLLDFLNKNNFIVIDINKLSPDNMYDKKYLYPPANWHPNAKAIRKVVPLLVKELDL